jgi:erythromycin esterase-like protein
MQRTVAILLVICCLIGLACAQSAQQNPSRLDQPAVDWIAANAVRLKTPEAGNGFADMQPLKKIIGNARIASLGEATHGTREFFQLKHRMLEFLASEMGFTIFSIEANMPEAYRLNDYVLNGVGDPAKLLKGMYFWTWDTQEVLAMIEWMREFNKSGKGRVQFTGFDMQTPDVAAVIVRDFVTKNDTAYEGDLQKAIELMKVTAQMQGPSFGVATAKFPNEAAAGKRVRYSGYIKTKGITRGWAGLWWRVDDQQGVLAFDNMDGRGATGTTDWKRYEIELPVAAEVKNINFGAILTGDGSAWFDGLEVTLDGKPYLENTNFDLGFESSTIAGFYTGGNGYQVTLDKSAFQSGSQSLLMTHVGTASENAKAVDPKLSIAAWRGVMTHLEDSRNAYAQKGIVARDVDWVIQNAQVVLQCIQMNANEVQRDQSMAANIKWILDHNPNAKIVLWAHNGHVAKNFVWGYKTMGSSLREMFGDQMVVFGFAFNQGSFQAIERGKGLHDFTIAPAPAGSLDATLAATGIPFLALDLRKIPKGSPVEQWWSQPHKSRNIGAMYATDMDNQFLIDMKAPDSFDVLLFVEKSTAARKNPAN